MRFVFLGCGGLGAPLIGTSPVGIKRYRSSQRNSVAFAFQPNYPEPLTLLLDAGPDIGNQWADWADAPRQPDAIIFTHGHHDHMGGAALFFESNPPVPAYGTRETLVRLKQFAAAVWPEADNFNLEPRPIPERGQTDVLGVSIETIPVNHTLPMTDTGLLIRHRGRFVAHLSDTNAVIEATVREAIHGCDLLLIHAPRMDDTEWHISIPSAIALAQEVAAKRLVLTHVTYRVSSEMTTEIEDKYPWVTVAHDGMVINL